MNDSRIVVLLGAAGVAANVAKMPGLGGECHEDVGFRSRKQQVRGTRQWRAAPA